MQYRPITEKTDLAALCTRMGAARYITVDTEFIRENTFWPQLCLIQVAAADGGEVALIDPLADKIDLGPFYEILRNPAITKVFHAARQDLEIFFHAMGEVPAPIFDTQLAACVCGYGDQVGYDALVRKICQRDIDKSSRFTDWARRPLTEKQLGYAASDVTHLRQVYEKLYTTLQNSGRTHWMEEEMTVLSSPATYESHPEQAWRRLKIRNRKPRFISILRALAAWREREAQRLNQPRNRILRDDSLMDIAGSAPDTIESLSRIRGLSAKFSSGRHGQGVLDAVRSGLANGDAHPPEMEKPQSLSPELQALVELLKVLLKACCAREGVAPRLVATTSDLEQIAMDDDADTPALRGWRRQLFGDAALALKQGQIALGASPKGVRTITLATPSPAS